MTAVAPVPAAAAVAAVGTAPGLEAGTAETHTAGAASSGLDGDFRLIGKGFQVTG